MLSQSHGSCSLLPLATVTLFCQVFFCMLSVLAEGMQLNPAGQGLCCIFPTLSTRSNGSWDDHLLFFLLGKIVERTAECQMKYPDHFYPHESGLCPQTIGYES